MACASCPSFVLRCFGVNRLSGTCAVSPSRSPGPRPRSTAPARPVRDHYRACWLGLALNQELIASAKARAGIKGYLTSLPVAGCPGRPVPDSVDPVDPLAVITAYHQLFEVKRSFRMSKTDLRARPIFSHVRH